jgi:TPR repeat protein
MFLFLPAALVGADNQAAYVDSLKKEAAQGDADAQFTLGFLYSKGEGVPQDHAEALKWFRLAAAQGHAKAQYNLGAMYGNGQGVPQNYVQALKWLTLAAATFPTEPEHGQAVQARDLVAARMTPAQIAEAQKLAREWQKQ